MAKNWTDRLENGWNRWINFNYCPNCQRKIVPKRDYGVVPLFLIGIFVALFLGFWVGFAIFIIGLTLASIGIGNKSCPICGCKSKDLEYRK